MLPRMSECFNGATALQRWILPSSAVSKFAGSALQSHVPHVDDPISAFGRCPGHPSRMAKWPHARIGPSKPCVAGIYPACRKTGRSFRLPAEIPYGSAPSGEIRGRFGDRGAPNGSRRQPSIDMPYSCIRSSCAFVKRLSPGRGSPAAG
jgi:hypothetical protein